VVLEILAPKDSKSLWNELCEHKGYLRTTGGKSWKDMEVLEEFAKSYLNSQR